MRKLAIAVALASSAMATPALAKDGAWYAGVEGGLMVVEDPDLDYSDANRAFTTGFLMNHKVGFDVDALAGYDLGMVRLEGELAYKRASLQDTKVDPGLSGTANGTLFFDTTGHLSIFTGMVNALLDFGDDNGWAGYVGGGAGYAQVKYSQNIDLTGLDFSDSDNSFAWQAIAGVRYAISPSMDVGLKYRFFNASNLVFNEGGTVPFELKGRVRTHSLLASLLWNFGAPPPPPPPPATQTCPDGSVILATDTCPAPPPPPPPPPPAPERGR